MAVPKNDAISRREMMQAIGAGSAAVLGAHMAGAAEDSPPSRPSGQKSALGLKHPPLDKVRVGMIGMGGRGTALMDELLKPDGVAIAAVCDIVPQRTAAAQAHVATKGRPFPAGYSKNEHDFENLCQRDDVDLVYIATPWEWHAAMAVCAMNYGKHAAIEVPAAITLQECWDLVDASERTQRHCMMLENCCYGETEMLVMNMVRQGVMGELTHGEAGYIHPYAEALLSTADSSVWRRRHTMKLNGNLYPTHGLGPVALYMDIHGGDRFDYLVSMSSCQRSLGRCRSIMVEFSLAAPRPYSRINLVSGTGGTFADYPPRLALKGKEDAWESDLAPYFEKYGHPLWRQQKKEALKSGGHGGMDYLLNWRLIQCLRAGRPLDMTVYDAAAWSSVFPLSVASVAKGSVPVSVPDFTRGQWKTPRPLLAADA
ncbi:MAG: Gfo/Idh/MocA family oxidoreductase [Thermoguttaceae bacterium]